MRPSLGRLRLCFFDALYGPLAWAYDPVAWLVSRGAWHDWVLAALPALEGDTLEIGSGTGHLLRALAERGDAPIGLDLSRPLLRRAEARLRGGERRGAVRLVRARGQGLPFGDAAFDRVVTTFPAPYVLERATCQEIRRVLRPDGAWILVDAPLPGGRGLWDRAARRALGSGGGERLSRRLEELGFTPRTRQATVGRDRVHVIEARPTRRHRSRPAT